MQPSLMIPVYAGPTDETKNHVVHGAINRAGIGAEYVPVLSIMAIDAVKISNLMACILTDDDIIWQLKRGGELMQPSFTMPDSQEAATRADKDAVGLSGGVVVMAGLMATTTNTGSNTIAIERTPDIELQAAETLTICIRKVSGTGGIVSVVANWNES